MDSPSLPQESLFFQSQGTASHKPLTTAWLGPFEIRGEAVPKALEEVTSKAQLSDPETSRSSGGFPLVREAAWGPLGHPTCSLWTWPELEWSAKPLREPGTAFVPKTQHKHTKSFILSWAGQTLLKYVAQCCTVSAQQLRAPPRCKHTKQLLGKTNKLM